MLKRSQFKKYILTLNEIESILSAMKTLSLIELNKINKYLEPQAEMEITIENALNDLFYFYPKLMPLSKEQEEPEIAILLGSERGFCGAFNDNIVSYINHPNFKNTKFLIIGQKLHSKINKDKILGEFTGPNAAEEIPKIIQALLVALEKFLQNYDGSKNKLNWVFVFNRVTSGGVQIDKLYPFKGRHFNKKSTFSYAPLLNVSPELLFPKLLHYHLFTLLHHVFYQSFLSENQLRFQHMENAISQLDKKIDNLSHQFNEGLKEDITEEIELLVLSAETVLQAHKK